MSTPIKLSGMASGLDTDTIIKQLMQVERMPLDKLVKQKQTISWKRDSYRETNSMLTAIRTLTDKMRFSSSFNKQSATSSDSSVVAATASSTATSGGFTVRVDSLASSALVAGDKIAVDLKSKFATTDGSFEIVGPKGTKKIEVTVDSTYESVIKQVNSANIGVTMSYDSLNSRFMLSTNSTGESASILVKDDATTGNIASNFFKLNTPTEVKGTNASVQVNGKSLVFENNAFEFNGVRFDLKGVSATTVSVTVAQDTSNIVGQIKGFVEQYNALVDRVNDTTKATPNRNYTPLTDEQKESMTEKQIDLWESKAKVGLLYRDDILTGALTSLRSVLMGKVSGLSGDMDSLSDIGVSFKGYTKGLTSELGKLEINEAKLTEAVTKNPDGVMNLFTKTSTLDSKDPNYQSETGYAERLYTTLTTQINKIIKRIGTGTVSDAVDGSQLGKQIYDLNDKMSTLQTRLETVEARYNKQFTAMEVAMQKLNNKSSWLTSQLSS